MKQIPLSRGKFAIVDDEDYERLVAMGKWKISTCGYAEKTIWIRTGDNRVCKTIKMHRLVVSADNQEIITDHINGNKIDNRKENLRICTVAENSRNASVRKDSISGYKGVSFHAKNKKYVARIRFNRKELRIGQFDCPVEAAKAYNEAAIRCFGEFAYLNKIPE